MADELTYDLPDAVAVYGILLQSEQEFKPYALDGPIGDTFKREIIKASRISSMAIAYLDTPEKSKIRIGFYDHASTGDRKSVRAIVNGLIKRERDRYSAFKTALPANTFLGEIGKTI